MRHIFILWCLLYYFCSKTWRFYHFSFTCLLRATLIMFYILGGYSQRCCFPYFIFYQFVIYIWEGACFPCVKFLSLCWNCLSAVWLSQKNFDITYKHYPIICKYTCFDSFPSSSYYLDYFCCPMALVKSSSTILKTYGDGQACIIPGLSYLVKLLWVFSQFKLMFTMGLL